MLTLKKLSLISLLLLSPLLLSGCKKKKSNETATEPTPASRLIELDDTQKPDITLTPRADGHELKLKIDKIPEGTTQIEYELIYTASDDGTAIIEKGLGDLINLENENSIERDLLLGTSSCTNGCKYKYDEGITGGTLSLQFIFKNDQVALFETNWAIADDKSIVKNGLSLADIKINVSSLSPGFYLLFQTYSTTPEYLVTSSSLAQTKGLSLVPDTLNKENPNLLTGIYR